ncbi:ATP-dependent zinc metalloprotease FtsH [Acidocella sp. KAb 2-4]|uniref:ATP-dependent zinc metalloprotease FtsH n=1 Tax=Acidocella sp. KAb 2-4 TaxID=2885158 RepID=UPI001D068356|nr:ATP-dependent zinc metalloprotease FtsH [Acidocella sp. KAb 2-4]
MAKKGDEVSRFGFILASVLLSLLLFSVLSRQSQQQVKTIPYSQFQSLLQAGQVDNLTVGDTQITGTLKNAPAGQPTQFETDRVDPALAQDLAKQKITFSGQPAPGAWATLFGWLAPLILFGGLWYMLLGGRMGGAGGVLSVGKSRARVYAENDVPVRFKDVAGVEEAKAELKEVVDFLKNPGAYGRLGAHIPKGVLLVGPPGTGKTLLARAVAGEAKVPFFSISGSEFVEMFVGVGAARVRDLFEQARRSAPAIIFIDELDSLGRARNAAIPGGGNDEKEQTLNQLLAEMDGFDPSSGVVLLAATNRPEILDPALLRAGRFDRQILVDRPDKAGRVQILGVHMRKIKLAPGVSSEEIAALTPGFTGADLANLVNEAALLATRRQAEAVTLEDFTEAVERIIAGLEKRTRLLVPKEREVVAHHELGHAITAMALPDSDKVQKISIIPHGLAALGYTIQRPGADRFIMGRQEMLDRMTVLLGGRAAESLIFPDVSTGAADDLMRATDIARSMVVRFGMDDKLGQMTYEPETPHLLGNTGVPDWRPRQYSEQTAAAIDAAVHDLVESAFNRSRAILQANMPVLREAARELLKEETISGDKLDELAAKIPPWTDRA